MSPASAIGGVGWVELDFPLGVGAAGGLMWTSARKAGRDRLVDVVERVPTNIEGGALLLTSPSPSPSSLCYCFDA